MKHIEDFRNVNTDHVPNEVRYYSDRGLGMIIYNYFIQQYELLKPLLTHARSNPRTNAKYLIKHYIKTYGK